MEKNLIFVLRYISQLIRAHCGNTEHTSDDCNKQQVKYPNCSGPHPAFSCAYPALKKKMKLFSRKPQRMFSQAWLKHTLLPGKSYGGWWAQQEAVGTVVAAVSSAGPNSTHFGPHKSVTHSEMAVEAMDVFKHACS